MLANPLAPLVLLILPYALAQISSAPSGAIPATAAPVVSSAALSAVPTSSTAVTPITPVTTAPPVLAMPALGTVYACGTARLNWQLLNVNPALYTVTFRAHNSGVDQSITRISATPTPSATASTSAISTTSFANITPPTVAVAVPSSSVGTTTVARIDVLGLDDPVIPTSDSSAVTTTLSTAPLIARHHDPLKRTSLSINQTMGTNSAAFGYSMPIDLPEGQYILVASIQEFGTMATVPFTVLEDPVDVSCLAAFAPSSSSSSSLSSTGSRSSSAGAPSGSVASSNNGAESANRGVSGGAIAGGVLGGLAGLSIIGLLVFCLMRRKRRNASNAGGRDMQEKEKAFRLGAQRLPSDSGDNTHSTAPTSAFAASYNSSLPQSQRASVSSLPSPFGTSPPDSPPRLPELASLGSDGEFDDPFATPALTSTQQHRLSAPVPMPAVKLDSKAESANRRKSSPITTFGSSPFYPDTLPDTVPSSQSISRSGSDTDGKRPSPSGSVSEGTARRGSMKRKAVPSLGPELRKQMERGGGAAPSGISGRGEGKKQFTLIPDMPGAFGAK